MKSAIPQPLATVIKDVVYPPDVDEDVVRDIRPEGHEMEVRRMRRGREDKVQITVQDRDGETAVRTWFGHVDPDADEAGVNGFQTVSVNGDNIVLQIPRPVLITEALD